MAPAENIDARPGPEVSTTGVHFRLNGYGEADAVRLELDFPVTGPVDFTPAPGGWELRFDRPAIDRMEYQFTIKCGLDTTWTIDPGNPLTVSNPFGAKSEIRFPGYRPPGWSAVDLAGELAAVDVDQGPLRAPLPVRVFSPAGLPPDQPAVLLVAHDGSDMADRGDLLRWACSIRPAVRVALLDPAPGLRDTWYAADPEYADHVATAVLPAISARVNSSAAVGLGASLGAVSMLTIQRRHPAAFAALALQSGSFFTAKTDPQESGYRQFDRLCAAVTAIRQQSGGHGVPTLMTCGAVEENRANNEAMAAVLAAQGYQVGLKIVPDAHTMIGWRNAWAPDLDELLAGVGQRFR